MNKEFLKNNNDILTGILIFFSNVLIKEPNENILKEIKDNNLFNEWFIEYKNDVEVIENLIEKNKKDLEEKQIIGDIKYDYTQLFIFGAEKIGAAPWGSVYLNKSNETYDVETVEVEKLYTKYGFKVSEDFKEPYDHIAIELLFIAYLLEIYKTSLSENETESENILEDFKLFLQTYVLTWVFSFINHMKDNANTNFYQLIAYLLNDFLKQLQETLEIKKIDVKIYY